MISDQEYQKIKYHHKLLLIIATETDNNRTRFFQNVVMFDLSEFVVKSILELVQSQDKVGLVEFISQHGNGYQLSELLKDLIAQELLNDSANALLEQ